MFLTDRHKKNIDVLSKTTLVLFAFNLKSCEFFLLKGLLCSRYLGYEDEYYVEKSLSAIIFSVQKFHFTWGFHDSATSRTDNLM